MNPFQTLLNLCGLASRQQLSEALERAVRAEVALDRLNALVLSLSAKCATKSAEIEALKNEAILHPTLKVPVQKPTRAERQMTEAALERLIWSLKGVPSNADLARVENGGEW